MEAKEKEMEKVMGAIRERYRFDINEIREHCEKYDRILEENREKIDNKSKIFMQSSKENRRKYQPNYFNVLAKNVME